MPRWPENPDDPVDPAIAPLIEAGEGESEGFDVAISACPQTPPAIRFCRSRERIGSEQRRLLFTPASTPPSRVVRRRVGPIAVLDRLLDGEAIEGRERAARGGAREAPAGGTMSIERKQDG